MSLTRTSPAGKPQGKSPQGKIENRRFLRVKPAGMVAKTGKIILDSRSPAIDCRVIDISRGGACLELSHPVTLPSRFEFRHGGVRQSCYLVWQKHHRLGITF